MTSDGALRGPDLPEDHDWPAQTKRWWETWRISAQSQDFTPSDWDFLLDTALLHARLWSGDQRVASELRLRVAKYGATPEDRARLRLQVDEPDGPKPDGQSDPQGGRYGHLRSVKSAG